MDLRQVFTRGIEKSLGELSGKVHMPGIHYDPQRRAADASNQFHRVGARMLRVQEHEPELCSRIRCFGHTNTFLLKRLVDRWAIDRTNASFNGLYRIVTDDGWDRDIANELGFDLERLPPVYHSGDIAGHLTPNAAEALGLPSGIPVVAGGGDTGIAALGAGVVGEGDFLNSTGTVEVMVLSTEHPVAKAEFLLCTHPLPGK